MKLDEILKTGTSVTVIGLVIVFSVLAIIWGILELMRVIFADKPKKAKEEVEPIPQYDAVVEPIDDEALIAVITAAIASSLNTSTYNLKIKSIKRSDSTWVRVARSEQLKNNY